MTDHDSILPPPAYFEERAALALLVPRAQVLAALADALDTSHTGGTVIVPRAPNAALLRPFISCPEAELPEAWEAMLRIAATMAGRAVPPAAPGEIVKAIREYLGVHPDLQLGGQLLDNMALELSRIALDYPAERIGALALEELMQLGYTVEAGAILPPRDLPEQACEFFGVRPVGRANAAAAPQPLTQQVQESVLLDPLRKPAAIAGPAWDKTRDSLSMLMMGFAGHTSPSIQAACAALDSATEPDMPLAYLRGATPALEAPAALAAKPGGKIAVPFDLVVAACSAIDKKRDAPTILAELRRYTTGDLSRALEAPAGPAVPPGFALVPTGRATAEMVIAASHAHAKPGASYSDLWAAMLAAAPQAPAVPADVGVVFDMVALVKQLVREHRIAEPHSLLAGAAMKYLQRHGLLDSPLRLHSDDAALDRFALAMRAKLAVAREKGRGGWETCPPEVLNRMLHEHLQKGDPLDVANFCMFLWQTGKRTTLPAPAAALTSDTALLNAMTQHRIALVPENEGPWDAQVYGETEATPMARATGATPREALSAALAAMTAAIQGGGAA